LIVLGSRTELVDGQRPLGLAAANRRGGFAPEGYRLNDALPVDGLGDGTPHTHVVERGLISAHGDRTCHNRQEIPVYQVRMAFLERLQVGLAYCPPVIWPAVDLPSAVHGQPG